MEAKIAPGAQIVFAWERSPKATLLAVVSPYEDETRFDVREYVPVKNVGLIPTKRGISLRADELARLRAAVQALEAAARAELTQPA